MKITWPLLALALLVPTPFAAAAPSAPGPSPCALVESVAALAGGPALRVERATDRVAVRDRRLGAEILVATCAGIELAPTSRRPTRSEPSISEVTRDTRGQVLFVRATTALGAEVLIVEPGLLNRDGLHVIAFDNDDLHVSDGRGALVYQRRALPDGSLVERDAAGCACERVTAPDGRVTVTPLDPTPR